MANERWADKLLRKRKRRRVVGLPRSILVPREVHGQVMGVTLYPPMAAEGCDFQRYTAVPRGWMV